MVKTHDFISESRKTTVEIQNSLTDPELYALCKKWGTEALQARRKFIGLLPEVNTRRLYERRKFRSLYHFAATLGGVGKRLVDEVLCLEKRFADMPTLHSALVNGEIGLSKLARIVSIVNVENEAEICEKIRLLSRRAVDILVREMMEKRGEVLNSGGLFGNCVDEDWHDGADNSQGLFDESTAAKNTYGVTARLEAVDLNSLYGNHVIEDGRSSDAVNSDGSFKNLPGGDNHHEAENRDGLQKPQSSPKSLSGRENQIKSARNFDFEILAALSPEVKAKLKELIDKEIDINAILLKILAEREAEITEKKAKIGKTPAKSRHIPVKIIRIIKEEFGSKCAYPGCQNPAEQIHHEKPFALYQDHNPRDLKPLCRGHHELEHVM